MATQGMRIGLIVLLVPFALLRSGPGMSAEPRYPETIAAIQTVYCDESKAQARYVAFAKKAQAEGYPWIGYFFHALSTSEGIHARNARELLAELGSEAKEGPYEPEVATTRENLKSATSFEINIIEQVYPGLLKKMGPERHVCARQSLTNELETERQHLDLLKKIQRGTGAFFGMLVKKFEGTPVEYFVCQVCGATAIEVPAQGCPICKSDAAEYKVVEKNF